MNDLSDTRAENTELTVLSGIERALKLAVTSVLTGGLSGHSIEESTTGSLLGAIGSQIGWINFLLDDSLPRCHWTQYKKSGNDLSSESWTGVDFSLILRVDDNIYRVATFQAKRSSNANGGFSSIQISPARLKFRPEPQLIRILRHSINYGPLRNLGRALSSAGWIHFLVYESDAMTHTPMPEMKDHVTSIFQFDQLIKKAEANFHRSSGGLYTKAEIEEKWNSFSPKTYNPDKRNYFFKLIESGTRTPAGEDADGWRTIAGADAAAAFIDATSPDSLVYEAASSSSYAPIVSTNNSFEACDASKVDLSDYFVLDEAQTSPGPYRRRGLIPK